MGINVGRFYLVTFTFGSMLAAIGGAFTAPTVSVVPGLGVDVIVLSFAVVVIGGLGSLPGAALGAVIVGLVRSISIHYAAAGRAVRDLFRDGAGARVPAARPVQPRRGEEDMSRDRTPLALALILAAIVAAGPFAAAVDAVPAHARARQGPGGAGPDAAPALRAGVLRAGALLLHRRLRGRRAGDPVRRERRAACRCSPARRRAALDRLRARLPAGALPRHLLRPAEPRAVDDPVRPAGQERGARLDRRLQRAALDAVRHPPGTRPGCATRCWSVGGGVWRSSRRCWCTATSARRSAGWRRRSRTTRSASSTWAPRRAARSTSST